MRIEDEKEAFCKGGFTSEDDGRGMAEVLDFNDVDNDECYALLDLLRLALVVVGERALACLVLDTHTRTAVTFLFFFHGFDDDAIDSLLSA